MVAGKGRLDVGLAHRERLSLHLVKAEYSSETCKTWVHVAAINQTLNPKFSTIAIKTQWLCSPHLTSVSCLTLFILYRLDNVYNFIDLEQFALGLVCFVIGL